METGARKWWLSGANKWGAELRFEDTDTRLDVATSHVGVRGHGVRMTRRRVTLAPGPGGPMDPLATTETVGGLTLPRSIAVGKGKLFLGSDSEQTIKVYDPVSQRMQDRFGLRSLLARPPHAEGLVLAITRAVLVVAWKGGHTLIAIHADAGITYDAAELPEDVRITDVCAASDGVAILGKREAVGEGQVWYWRPGRSGVHLVNVYGADWATQPERILTDCSGCAFLFDRATAELARVDFLSGRFGSWTPVDAVRDDFAPLPVEIEKDKQYGWRLRVPADGPTTTRSGRPSLTWPVFDPQGKALTVRPDAPTGAPPYERHGTLEIGPLDSHKRGAMWDRILIDLAAFPPGTTLRIATWTSDFTARPLSRSAPWSPEHHLTAPDGGPPVERLVDFAVLGGTGRYLWLRLTLEGGMTSPEVRAVTLEYSAGSLTDYLPAVYREADADTQFLKRFLGALERTWRPLEDAIDNLHLELRPSTAGAEMLDFLSSWIAEPIVPDWGPAARRRAVTQGADRAPRRGTPQNMQQALGVFVANRWGVGTEALGAVPLVWEHFRSRILLRTPIDDAPKEGEGTGTLFGETVLRRIRIGTSKLGEGKLRDLGSPSTDPVTIDAHRFSVFLPASLVPHDHDVRGLRQVLDRERPAHTVGSLVLVEPRFRVGVQATLGVDTALGAFPMARLAAEDDEFSDTPPARLDYDCLLTPSEGVIPTPSAGGRGGWLPWRLG